MRGNSLSQTSRNPCESQACVLHAPSVSKTPDRPLIGPGPRPIEPLRCRAPTPYLNSHRRTSQPPSSTAAKPPCDPRIIRMWLGRLTVDSQDRPSVCPCGRCWQVAVAVAAALLDAEAARSWRVIVALLWRHGHRFDAGAGGADAPDCQQHSSSRDGLARPRSKGSSR